MQKIHPVTIPTLHIQSMLVAPSPYMLQASPSTTTYIPYNYQSNLVNTQQQFKQQQQQSEPIKKQQRTMTINDTLNNPYQTTYFAPISSAMSIDSANSSTTNSPSINDIVGKKDDSSSYSRHLLSILNPVQQHHDMIDDQESGNENDNSLPTFKQFESRLSSSSKQTPSSSVSSSGSPSSSNLLSGSRHINDSPCSSSPPSPYNNHNSNISIIKNQVHQWMQELADLKRRESVLIDNIKNYNAIEDEQINLQQQQQQQLKESTIITPQIERKIIEIQQQPSESVVCHRYIHPSPTLLVDPEVLASRVGGTVVLQATLVYSSTMKPVTTKQSDDKQDVLQGVKTAMVERGGQVVFNKLKVNEVSSKHLHQPFCLVFTLNEYHSDGRPSTFLGSATSSPFHVLSRNNNNGSASATLVGSKRKKEDDSDLSDGNDHTSSPTLSSPSSPAQQLVNHSSNGFSLLLSEESSSPSHPSTSVVPSSPSTQHSSGNDPNYIDITELLVLPQKEAASRLGISESMLCKRFKECTRRKWPYRYLRKIDKVIKIITFQHGNDIPREEKEKYDKLMMEREECLRPVKIRITGCLEKEDETGSPAYAKAFSNSINANSVNLNGGASHASHASSSSMTPPTKSHIQNIINSDDDDDSDDAGHSQPYQASSQLSHLIHSVANNNESINKSNIGMFTSNTGGEGNNLENILETLEMLKHTRQ